MPCAFALSLTLLCLAVCSEAAGQPYSAAVLSHAPYSWPNTGRGPSPHEARDVIDINLLVYQHCNARRELNPTKTCMYIVVLIDGHCVCTHPVLLNQTVLQTVNVCTY